MGQHTSVGSSAQETSVPGRAHSVTVAQIDDFDEIIDVRTPSEFADDHLPHAVNRPVLSDDERARVGTIYKQVSAFSGRKVGAALVARNIARHVEESFFERARSWRPLVYCWRGGKRSDAMVHILRQIGWDAHRLDGGYRAYRRAVLAELSVLTARLHLRVVCGMTGSGKSRLLQALRQAGAQVLDLEDIARHRGSALGDLPDRAQPSQKMFESAIWDALRKFTSKSPVFVESESKRIGALHLPDALISAMWRSECIDVKMDRALRTQFLLDEYKHLLTTPDALGNALDRLIAMHGRATIENWKAQAGSGDWQTLVGQLLERHYDPSYTRSIARHYPRLCEASRITIEGTAPAHFTRAAAELLARNGTGATA